MSADDETPTGKTRFRIDNKSWFSKPVLVLQIEVKYLSYEYTPNDSVTSRIRTKWVDATVEDITANPLLLANAVVSENVVRSGQ